MRVSWFVPPLFVFLPAGAGIRIVAGSDVDVFGLVIDASGGVVMDVPVRGRGAFFATGKKETGEFIVDFEGSVVIIAIAEFIPSAVFALFPGPSEDDTAIILDPIRKGGDGIGDGTGGFAACFGSGRRFAARGSFRCPASIKGPISGDGPVEVKGRNADGVFIPAGEGIAFFGRVIRGFEFGVVGDLFSFDLASAIGFEGHRPVGGFSRPAAGRGAGRRGRWCG